MYRQTGVLAACVECYCPDCWTCASASDGASCWSWPGVGTCTSCVCSTVGGAMSIPCLHRAPRQPHLTSSQHRSNLPLVSRGIPTCACQITYPLTSSRQRLNPRAAASSQTSFLVLRFKDGQSNLVVDTSSKVGRFIFFLTLTSQSRPRPACTVNTLHIPTYRPLPEHPAHNTAHHHTYDFKRPPRPQRQPKVPQYQSPLRTRRRSSSEAVLSQHLQASISC